MAVESAVHIDIAIRGGLVYDGRGAAPRLADIGVAGDRVVAIGNVPTARLEIDATRHVVCPGFIDVHAHDDYAFFCEPDMHFKVGQGVTTEVIGNCGIGGFPFGPGFRHFTKYYPRARPGPWDDFAGYLRAVRAAHPRINVAALVAHGMVREQVMGLTDAAPTRRELRQMSALLADGLSSGAFGMSTGLVYEPGRSASKAELIELARLVADASGVHATHLRNEAAEVGEAVREAIDVSRESGVRLQISHLKVAGRENHGKASILLRQLVEARASGVSAHHDAYPYTAVGTHLVALLRGAKVEREGVIKSEWGTFEANDLTIASCPAAQDLEGRSLGQLGEEWGLDTVEAAERLLERSQGSAFVTVALMTEPDVIQILEDDHAMIGSDGVPTDGGVPHPRLYGTFPRFIGRVVRASRTVSMAEAIRRVTSLPAAVFGLVDRGVLDVGAFADILVLDAARFVDVADYSAPRRLGPGISHVLINGTRAIADARFTNSQLGRVLIRG